MSVTALSAFTPQQAISVVALGVPKAFALPAGSSPSTVLVSNLGPEEAEFFLTTAAATTTATQSVVGSYTIVVNSASNIAVGQNVIGVGILDATVIPISAGQTYPNSNSTTTVVGINGTTITLSTPTTAALSSTTVNFVNPLTPGTGFAVSPHLLPEPVVIGSNTFIQCLCKVFYSTAILNVCVGV